MCLQDVQIGYATRHIQRNFVIGTTAQRVLVHNPKRWGILWGNPSSGTIWVSPDPTVVAGRGFSIQNSFQAPFWNLTLHGDVVTEEIWVVGSVASITWSLIETEFAGL